MSRLITVIVPVYKVEEYLDRCVKSLLRQSYQDLEILLVDDGSPDKCPEICDRWTLSDSRIKAIHKENGGLSDARNCGLRRASGQYILYVDSDDFLEPYACEMLEAAFTEEVDIVAGVARNVYPDNSIIEYRKRKRLKSGIVYSAKEFIIESIKANNFYAQSCFCMYRRDFLIDNSLFFVKGIFYEDMELLPRLCLAAGAIKYVSYPFYNHCMRFGSIMMSPITEKKISDILCIWSKWIEVLETVSDGELKRYMYGALVRYYLYHCRLHKITGWRVPGLDGRFAFRCALGFRDKLKVLMFSALPDIYIRL